MYLDEISRHFTIELFIFRRMHGNIIASAKSTFLVSMAIVPTYVRPVNPCPTRFHSLDQASQSASQPPSQITLDRSIFGQGSMMSLAWLVINCTIGKRNFQSTPFVVFLFTHTYNGSGPRRPGNSFEPYSLLSLVY